MTGTTRSGAIRARAERSGVWGSGGHAAITGALVGAGSLGAALVGAPAAEVATGAALAWSIQAGAVWRLMVALSSGRSATRPWLAGMAARLTGLAAVAALAWTTGLAAEPMAVAYVGAVIPLLWLEGLWLNRAVAGTNGPGSDDTRATDERTDGT